MNAPISQELVTAASAVAAIAINALWQDALLVLGVWGLLRAWPHLNASTRYTVWSATSGCGSTSPGRDYGALPRRAAAAGLLEYRSHPGIEDAHPDPGNGRRSPR